MECTSVKRTTEIARPRARIARKWLGIARTRQFRQNWDGVPVRRTPNFARPGPTSARTPVGSPKRVFAEPDWDGESRPAP